MKLKEGLLLKIRQLESQLSKIQGRNKRLKMKCDWWDEEQPALIKIREERDALQKEVERLSGKTGFCTQCERHAKEVQRLQPARLKRVLEEID